MPHLKQSMQKMSLHEQNNSKPGSPSVKKKLNYPPGLRHSKNVNKSVDLSQPPPLSTNKVSPGPSFPRLTNQTSKLIRKLFYYLYITFIYESLKII